jgi:zinc-ribbon domain
MAYLCEPHPGQQVFVEYRDGHTRLLCRRSQPGSQQQASSSFSTGNWTQPPELWRSPHGQFIHIHSAQGPILVQITPNGLQVIGPATIPPPIEVIPLQPTDAMPAAHQARHRHTTTTTAAWTTRNHHDGCPACGQLVRSVRDRFCANCGQKLH